MTLWSISPLLTYAQTCEEHERDQNEDRLHGFSDSSQGEFLFLLDFSACKVCASPEVTGLLSFAFLQTC